MHAKNYQVCLRRFKDKSTNVCWPHFFEPRCICRMPDDGLLKQAVSGIMKGQTEEKDQEEDGRMMEE